MVVSGILLAAGRGERFDPSGQRYKLAQSLPDGRSVFRTALDALHPHVDHLIVVLGERSNVLKSDIPAFATTVCCADAHLGMGASIRAGVAAAPDPSACLITLGDMPAVRASTITQLRGHLEQGVAIVRPFFSGRPGHPVGFSPALYSALLAIPDSGARGLLQQHATTMMRLSVNDPGCVADVDYPSDLDQFG